MTLDYFENKKFYFYQMVGWYISQEWRIITFDS